MPTSLLSLGVPTVDEALGWSWLIDMGQGDFATARAAAEQALTERRNANTVFARAVVHTLQGEFDTAFPLFEEAFMATQDPNLQILIASQAHLAERQRGEILPDGVSLFFPEVNRYWGYYSPDTIWERRWQELRKQVGDLHIVFEATLLREWFMLPTYRANCLFLTNTSHPDAQQAKVQGSINFGSLYQTARHLGLMGFLGPILAARSELTVLRDHTLQAKILDILAGQIGVDHQLNNSLGVAWLYLCIGDLLAMPERVGHPILFGYRLSDSGANTTTPNDPALFDRSKGDLARARINYDEALRGFTATNLLRGKAMAGMRLAYLDAIEGKLPSAFQNYTAAQQQFDAAGDLLNAQAAIAGNLWVRWQLGEPDLEVQARCLANEARTKDALAWGLSWGLAFAYAGREALLIRGDVEASLSAATIAQAVFETLDTPLRCAQTCGDRAAALQTLEETDGSTIELDTALGWLTQMQGRLAGNDWSAITIGSQLALELVHVYAGQFDAKGLERTRDRASTLAAGVPEVVDIESRLKPLRSGLLSAMKALSAEKIDQIFQDVNNFTIRESLDLAQAQATVYIPLSEGIEKMESGQEEAAAKSFQTSLQAAKMATDSDFLQAMTYTGWHRFSEARKALRRYIVADMPKPANKLYALRSMFSSDFQNINDIEQQERIGDRELAATLFTRMKAWTDARIQLDEIARLAGPPQPLGDLPTRDAIYTRFREGLIAEGLGKREQALHCFAEAAKGLETHRRYLHKETLRRALGGQNTTHDVYAGWARVLADLGKWDDAFIVADYIRARVLSEALGETQAATHQLTVFRRYNDQIAVVERLTSQLTQTSKATMPDQKRINAIKDERAKAIAELIARESTLFQVDPHWRELVAPQAEVLKEIAERCLQIDTIAAPQTGMLKKIAECYLPTNTLLLAYLFTEERLLMWAVTNTGLVSQCSIAEYDGKLFRAQQFAIHIRESVQQLDNEQRNMALAQVLLQPFDALIAPAEHLLIVPYAELNMFPFQALPWRGQPLGLRKVISYLPAASLLQYMRSSDPVAAGALVVGDPDDMWQPGDDGDKGHPLQPLPAARVEAQTVAAIYSTHPFIGSQATKEAILSKIANNPKVIHFATHGYFQSKVPLASGIALANKTILSVDEVMSLDIKADVVVLSACETGRGKLQGSELVGLARSLIYAGTRSAIVTLWQVNDLATAILMQSLHRHLHKDRPAAAALQQSIDDLYHTTVQQALDFCTVTLANLPRQSKEEQAAYATLTRRMGEVLAIGDDYAQAIIAYHQAIAAFRATGYTNEINELEEICSLWILLASDEDVLQPERRAFDHPNYWAAFEVIGDWQ